MTPRDILRRSSRRSRWGLAFIAIKFGVREAPPLPAHGAALRFRRFSRDFCSSSRRAPRPPSSSSMALLIGVGQFGLLFLAIGLGMPIGLASLVIQLQAFITIVLAWVSSRRAADEDSDDRRRESRCLGIAAIGATRLGGASLGPFLLVVGAAFCWGVWQYGRQAGRTTSTCSHLSCGRASPRRRPCWRCR